MIRGLAQFKNYFEDYANNYVIIGGTACDLIISEAGFTPRATKGIDIVLVVEALNASFVREFWLFIKEGHYERAEKSRGERKYYRFTKPENENFPFQIELFARNPDLLDFDEAGHLTPIPVEDDLSSLSAILLNEDYYHFLIQHSTLENGLQRANAEALICLKAKACLEIEERIIAGSGDDKKQMKKHRNDVFRLAVMLAENDVYELPLGIKQDLQRFVDQVADKLPDKAIFKEMGLSTVAPEIVFHQIIKSFQLYGK